MTQIYPIDRLTQEQLQEVVRAIDSGAVAAFATDTVYGLGTNAFDEGAIQRIYQLKQRPAAMPLQMLIDTVEKAKQMVVWNQYAEKLAAAYWPGALTLILPASKTGKPLLRGFEGLGLRVPNYAPLQRLLAQITGPLASTSANIHGQAVWTREEEVIAHLTGKVDYILTGGNLPAVASSVIELVHTPRLLRQGSISRGQLEAILANPLK